MKEENDNLQGKLEMAGADLEELQREIENANLMLNDKDKTIKLLRKNIKILSSEAKKYGVGSTRGKIEKELQRLIDENEKLRSQLIQNQVEYEEKERQLISEFNNMIMEDNEQMQDDED